MMVIYFVADACSISRAQSNNTRVQNWLVIADYRLGDSTQSTLRGAKTLSRRPDYNGIRSSSDQDLSVGEK